MIDSHRILVVDDDSENIEFIRELCENLNCIIDTAESARKALELVKNTVPDLILLDLQLPDEDGFHLLKELKSDESTLDIPVVIVTASTDVESKARGIEMGADDFLCKPFKLFELKTRIKSTLRGRKTRDSIPKNISHKTNEEDPVTRAAKFVQLHSHLEYEFNRARRYNRPLSALMLSIDDFAALCEKMDREKCNSFLAEVVNSIRQLTRETDHIFRIDEAQFLVLLPETNLKGAKKLCSRILKSTEKTDIFSSVRCLTGIASYPDPGIFRCEDLLYAAHEAMNSSGRTGQKN